MNAQPPAVSMTSARAWILAARLKTLPAAVVPVFVGCAVALAVRHFRWPAALAALFGALLIQIGTNFVNDVADFEKGADTHERLGPMRAVQAGLLGPRQMIGGAVVAFAGAALCGVYLTAVAGWPVIAIGVASIAAGVAYTAGPFPLGYHGLGDVFVFVFFGLVAVCGTVFVQAGFVPPLAVWAAIPVGALSTAILVVNNLRDCDTDAKVGKRTLAVRWGKNAAVGEYAALVLLAYAVPCVLAVGRSPWILLPLLTAPLALWRVCEVARNHGPALNRSLAATAQLLLLFGIFLCLGVLSSAGPVLGARP